MMQLHGRSAQLDCPRSHRLGAIACGGAQGLHVRDINRFFSVQVESIADATSLSEVAI